MVTEVSMKRIDSVHFRNEPVGKIRLIYSTTKILENPISICITTE